MHADESHFTLLSACIRVYLRFTSSCLLRASVVSFFFFFFFFFFTVSQAPAMLVVGHAVM